MQNLPTINIVTVCYNAANTIQQTISSIISQTYQNINFIIIDGKSSDRTIDIIEKNSNKINIVVSEPDKGIYDAMNKASRYFKEGWVLFIGADDELTSATIIEEVAACLVNENTIYYGNSFFIKRKKQYDGFFSKYKLALRNISHQSAFYPVEIFKQFSFNTKYKLLADYHLNIQLYNHPKYRFKYISHCVTNFNDNASSSNNTDVEFEKDKPELVKKHLGYMPFLYIVARKKIKRILLYKNE